MVSTLKRPVGRNGGLKHKNGAIDQGVNIPACRLIFNGIGIVPRDPGERWAAQSDRQVALANIGGHAWKKIAWDETENETRPDSTGNIPCKKK